MSAAATTATKTKTSGKTERPRDHDGPQLKKRKKDAERAEQTISALTPAAPVKSNKQIAFVGNLAFDCTEQQLRGFFANCRIQGVRLLTDAKTKDFKGCGFVEFASGEDLQKALCYHNRKLNTRKVRVELPAVGSSKEKKEATMKERKKELTRERREAWETRKKGAEKMGNEGEEGAATKASSSKRKSAKAKKKKSSKASKAGESDGHAPSQPKKEILTYEHDPAELERLKKKFRLNEDGAYYLRRQEGWVLQKIDQFCRIPDQSIRDPTGWMIKFANQLKREEEEQHVQRLHPVFSVREEEVAFAEEEVKFAEELDLGQARSDDDAAAVLPADILSDDELVDGVAANGEADAEDDEEAGGFGCGFGSGGGKSGSRSGEEENAGLSFVEAGSSNVNGLECAIPSPSVSEANTLSTSSAPLWVRLGGALPASAAKTIGIDGPLVGAYGACIGASKRDTIEGGADGLKRVVLFLGLLLCSVGCVVLWSFTGRAVAGLGMVSTPLQSPASAGSFMERAETDTHKASWLMAPVQLR
eukprot:g14884.t1